MWVGGDNADDRYNEVDSGVGENEELGGQDGLEQSMLTSFSPSLHFPLIPDDSTVCERESNLEGDSDDVLADPDVRKYLEGVSALEVLRDRCRDGLTDDFATSLSLSLPFPLSSSCCCCQCVSRIFCCCCCICHNFPFFACLSVFSASRLLCGLI